MWREHHLCSVKEVRQMQQVLGEHDFGMASPVKRLDETGSAVGVGRRLDP